MTGIALQQGRHTTTVFRITDLDCPDCAAKLEARIRAIAGVGETNLNFGAAKLTVSHVIPAGDVLAAIRQAGHAAVVESALSSSTPIWLNDIRFILTAASGLFLAGGYVADVAGAVEGISIALFIVAAVVGGYRTAHRAVDSARSLSLDMNVLMTVAVLGAAAIGEWSEGASVAFLFSLSNTLESYTMDRTRRSIRMLMDLSPRTARVARDGVEMDLPVDEVLVGDRVVIRPGERLPVDGRVLGGHSSVDQSPITGESIPVEVAPGADVFAGTVNGHGSLEVEATRPASDTTLARIIHLVEEAQAQRAPSQQSMDRFARVYTPAVIALAAGIAALPPLALDQPFSPWFYRALALLVVSCPCALVISTPVSIVAAIGNAARNGILIKGGAHLEEAGTLRVVAFDKTGTLTRGRPEVVAVVPLDGYDEATVIAMAAAVESRSEHPLGAAVMRHAGELGIRPPAASGFQAIPGRGASASIDGETWFAGSERLFGELDIEAGRANEIAAGFGSEGHTVIVLGNGRGVAGVIALADRVRPESRTALALLRRSGIERAVMLTGDNRATAAAIAGQLGIDEFRAELLPEDKVDAVKDLCSSYGKVAMVGDGINDAPALATASVGVAMGVAGTDTALETADIALMGDDLTRLAYAMDLSRRTVRVIKQNIAFALAVKLAAVLLVFPGWLTLWLAVAADMGASLAVTINGMRLIRTPASQLQ